MPRWFPIALLFCLTAATGLRAQTGPAALLLNSCQSVRDLSRETAAQGLPVRLQGLITVLPSLAGGGFTLDDGVGVWIARPRVGNATARPADLKVGDWVEIEGVTQPGHFLPSVAATRVRRLGTRPLPAPREIGLLDLTNGALDGQRVVVNAVVQSADRVVRDDRTELRLVASANGLRFSYAVFVAPGLEPETLVDAEVRLTGVFMAYFNARRQFLGVRIQSNDPADVRIVRPAPGDAFAAPEVTLSDGILFSAQGGSPHRRRVRGVVTLSAPGKYFFLQEGEHALRVNTRQEQALHPGDVVEASGFFSLEHHKAEMLDAAFRCVGHTAPPTPVEVARERLLTITPGSAEFLSRDFDDYLISVRGTLVSVDPGTAATAPKLNFSYHGTLVQAELESRADAVRFESLRPGSDLRVTGICVLTFSGSRPVVEWPLPVAMRLLLRDAGDVTVLHAASWWTAERLWSALVVIGAGLLLALAWVVGLRRTVMRRSRELAESMRERRDAAVEFESTLRERNRLAADLHDTLEQSLTGIAHQLEASEALYDKGPDRSRQHLGLARQVLDRSREDLRRSIWDLRANPRESADLTGALRGISADRSAGIATRIVVVSEGESRPVPDFVAGNLLLLVQEGITNALKHAAPTQIELRVRFGAGALTLEVADNGTGFVPAEAAGPREGHFGLQGMRERMKRLGGKLEIISGRDSGTVIRVTVPE